MSGKKILVVAAHPDDEVLGCGATIARHVKLGDEVNVVILAEGVTSRDAKRETSGRSSELSALHESAKKAGQVLGARSTELLNFPDNRLDSVDLLDIVKAVEAAITKHKPDVIYTHHAGDLNVDHRRTHEAVVTACRPVPGRHYVAGLLFFEIPSSTEWQTAGSGAAFTPTWFVDVSETFAIKLKALECYESEMRPWPHPRSMRGVEHLSRWRGATMGVEAAEAFVLGRFLDRR